MSCILMKLEILLIGFKKFLIWNFIEILSMGTELFHAEANSRFSHPIFLDRFGWNSVYLHAIPFSNFGFRENRWSEKFALLEGVNEK